MKQVPAGLGRRPRAARATALPGRDRAILLLESDLTDEDNDDDEDDDDDESMEILVR